MAMTSPLGTIDTAFNLDECEAGQRGKGLGQSTNAQGEVTRD